MGWMQRLCQTYDNMRGTDAFTERGHPLVPAGFIEKRAAIHVTLTEDGAFARAERFPEDEQSQIIPSSPEAEARVGFASIPFPLCEQLRYVAGDISENDNLYYNAYIADLSDWCARSDAPAQLRLLRDYLAQRHLMADMLAAGFSVDPEKDAKSFVCFSVESYAVEDQALWRREDVRESWLMRLGDRMGGRSLCYVEGIDLPALENHPKLQGNAKLISAKDDKTVFQYRGRFEDSTQALSVSFDASVKAHNALIWLLKRQGFDRYGLKVVAWATSGHPVPSPIADDGPDFLPDEAVPPDTFEAYGRAVRDAADGLAQDFSAWKKEAVDRVVILGLEAATTGRMSITYYQELPGGEYVRRLERWFAHCMWQVRRYEGAKESRRLVQRVFTPTPLEIAAAAMGKRAADIALKDRLAEKSATKLMRQTRMRLIKCVVDGMPIPHDIVLSAFRNASAPLGYTNDDGRWQEGEWRQALSTACALIRLEQAEQGEEAFDVKLNEEIRDRSYLYGRLLALCDMVEFSAMDEGAYRQTNAIRYMQRFQQRPFEMWPRLHDLIRPYLTKLGPYSERYKKLIGQVEVLFEEEDRDSRAPLDAKYLQGYYSQRQALFTKKEEAKGAENHDEPQ